MSFVRQLDFDFSTPAPGRGQRAYLSGLAAEDAVERHYRDLGRETAARRWRKAARQGGGEIDLVMRDGAALIFVEVKKARDFATAAERVTPRQIHRLQKGAAAFLAGEPQGQDTECRFDLALVNNQGEVEILENALMGY